MSLDQILGTQPTGAAASGAGVAGDLSMAEIEALNKSLTAGYESDVNGMAGGSALRIQSLDTTMQATVQDNAHFALFNALAKPRATAVLDEWTEQHSIGGFFGGTFNDQDGQAMETQGDYQRMVGRVKYMSTYRKIPIVLQQQNNIADAVSLETTNGTKQLLTDIEFSLFEGNDAVTPKAFAGIRQQLESLNSADNIIDMAGQALSNIDPIALAAQNIFGFGAFGKATDIYLPPSVQTDLNQDLDPAFRVMLNGSASTTVRGTHVAGVQTSFGQIKTNTDVFIRDEKLKTPFETRNALHAAVAAANVGFKPQTLAAAAGAGAADSMWGAAHAGQYYYAATGINQYGETGAVLSTQVTVAAGQQVTLTITGSAGGTETGYVIYRGRLNGTNALTDLREMTRVAKTGATTTYVDKNRELPGSCCAFVLNLSASDHAISWRQFLPMMKIPMAAVNSPIIPWLQMICGYLRITKRNQHVMIKNIVPNSAKWKPFN
jgi:hypothetical protein